MDNIFSITFALLITFAGAEIIKKFHYPRVIGQLTISLVLAIPLLQHLFNAKALDAISLFSTLGVIFLLLLTGFELDLQELKHDTKDAIIIALGATLVPLIFGFLLGHYYLGSDWKSSFVLGACLSITAEGTTVALLLEMHKVKSRIGSIILGAGILDDIFEILFLSITLVLSYHATAQNHIFFFLEKLILFILSVFLAFKYLAPWIQKLRKNENDIPLISAMIIIGLTFAVLSEFVGLGSLLGAFLAGIVLQKSFFNPKTREMEAKNLQLLVFAFIIPFFFINIGLNFDYHVFLDQPLLTIIIVLTAVSGKLIGTFLTKPFLQLSWQQLHLIGWGMNSRGVMELIIAHLALTAGLISSEVYSAIIFMAVLTTVLFPFAFRQILKHNPHIME